VLFGKRLVDISGRNAKDLEESKIIDRNLNSLLMNVKNDIEAMVMLDKNQPIFEICAKDGANGFYMFFFTTNGEKHVTTAVKYDVAELEFGKVEISRTDLDGSATLDIQMAINGKNSFKKFFEKIDQSHKQTRKFAFTLSDFRIRATIKKDDGQIIFPNPNVKILCMPDKVSYDKSGKFVTVNGELLYFDVTARALLSSDAAKLDALKNSSKIKQHGKANDFMFMYSRRSFGRIIPAASRF
jgi:hypothetical protein